VCGLIGFLSSSGSAATAKGLVEDSLVDMRHRGPDEGGVWSDDDVVIGFRRLSIIDLEGGLDHCVPTVPNNVLYIYFPIYDEELPNLAKLNAVADLGAGLIRSGHRVLSHCGMGFNRSALVAGLILFRLGMTGPEAVKRLRDRRQGALFNEVFAAHLESLGAR
jgi:hypothetical protein